jgi:phospholipid/cholesterol/gamma-HCH transport system substrate-binding protein
MSRSSRFVRRSASPIARTAAFAGLAIAAVVLIGLLLTSSGESYVVTARFQDASQLVKGNDVQVAGVRIGQVESIDLSDNGGADVRMKIVEPGYAPLRRGTEAVVRLTSVSGVANRYVELKPPSGDGGELPDGGRIETRDTTSTVDLDKLLNAFDKRTRASLQDVVQGFGRQYSERAKEVDRGWLYLNPSLAATSRLFEELSYDTPAFEEFIVASSRLVTDVAERRRDLSGLVDELATATGAIAREREALGDAIGQLPPFMRRANTTFVNLRSTIDELRPLVAESKPVAKQLRPFFAELRPLARDARPTLRALSRATRSPGANNDLLELTRSNVGVRDIAVGPVRRNGAERRGALPETTDALRGNTEPIGFLRPYAVDLTGWFDDFGRSGLYDALGGTSRVASYVNAFGNVDGVLKPILPELRDEAGSQFTARDQRSRCPGAADHVADDKSNPWKPSPDFNCDPSQVIPDR